MDLARAVHIVDNFDEPEFSDADVLRAWQYLIDSGAAWQLPEDYGRVATCLLQDGMCRRPGRLI